MVFGGKKVVVITFDCQSRKWWPTKAEALKAGYTEVTQFMVWCQPHEWRELSVHEQDLLVLDKVHKNRL